MGTKPILGTQVIFKKENDFGLLPLIATNETGYIKMVELSSKSYLNNDGLTEPYCQFSDLLSNSEGIIVMSGTINGFFGKLFKKGKIEEIENLYKDLKNTFKNNFYIEIQRHGDHNEKLFENFNLKLSGKLDIPIIASHEIFYIDKSMHDAHEALICIGNKSYLNDKNRISYTGEHLSLIHI